MSRPNAWSPSPVSRPSMSAAEPVSLVVHRSSSAPSQSGRSNGSANDHPLAGSVIRFVQAARPVVVRAAVERELGLLVVVPCLVVVDAAASVDRPGDAL